MWGHEVHVCGGMRYMYVGGMRYKVCEVHVCGVCDSLK